jgi:hypothetical protein
VYGKSWNLCGVLLLIVGLIRKLIEQKVEVCGS